jgi:antirestriction protein ArdC
MERAPPHDYRKEVTDRVVELMEAGTASWQQTWENRPLHLPMNPPIGKFYRGGMELIRFSGRVDSAACVTLNKFSGAEAINLVFNEGTK